MKSCYFCSIEEDKALLYEGIHKSEGRVYVCRKCYHKNKIPLIEKKEVNWDKVNERSSVRDRLKRMAGIKEEKKSSEMSVSESHEEELKKLVQQNLKKEVVKKEDVRDLVDNFNWIVMRKRRSMKITQKQLAEAVYEDTLAIQSIEKGILPRDYGPLVKKIESYLGVKLFRDRIMEPEDIIHERRVPSGIRIGDLKKNIGDKISPEELSLKRIEEISGRTSSDKEDDLTDEEIEDLIWGRK